MSSASMPQRKGPSGPKNTNSVFQYVEPCDITVVGGGTDDITVDLTDLLAVLPDGEHYIQVMAKALVEGADIAFFASGVITVADNLLVVATSTLCGQFDAINGGVSSVTTTTIVLSFSDIAAGDGEYTGRAFAMPVPSP
jgi:hypothetical protein